jgi:hypothetical protein
MAPRANTPEMRWESGLKAPRALSRTQGLGVRGARTFTGAARSGNKLAFTGSAQGGVEARSCARPLIPSLIALSGGLRASTKSRLAAAVIERFGAFNTLKQGNRYSQG